MQACVRFGICVRLGVFVFLVVLLSLRVRACIPSRKRPVVGLYVCVRVCSCFMGAGFVRAFVYASLTGICLFFLRDP